ncbi:unnamed protein product [Didymodactylos carnosus]|uniref:Secreted protein n=1 Tax=Didymodactylos carnosus TaxID=1234261 RepID=A0A813SX63_9BILA|nr:unnamed protein product [Didymodactylos carnosus]CAF1463008.1 unnamed protein product [Didymodactylos carnosus]CAF3585486.1 unnamed protein product [Didymodactylos carnosus]CAF4256016.1 unnamed protein product [Didymodactylos carnosus]
MTRQMINLILLVAYLLIANSLVINGDSCYWLGCHAHSADSWCPPGTYTKDWGKCMGGFGKQEYCCKKNYNKRTMNAYEFEQQPDDDDDSEQLFDSE